MRQRMWHNIRDNHKIKEITGGNFASISFEDGIQRTLKWLMEKPVHRRLVKRFSDMIDNLYEEYDLAGHPK